MDFHPLHPSPLPREDEAPHERFNVLAAECMAIKGNLDCRNFQLQPLHVHAIVKRKVEDVKENLKPLVTCCLKIASRMRDGTFLAHGFLMQPKLGTCTRKILQMELQIPRGQKWPVQDVSIDIKFNMFRPSKIPASLLLDAQTKMSPLLQPSQSTGGIPSSGSVHQQPNETWQDGRLQYMQELGAKYKGEKVMMSSETPKPDAPPPSGPPRLFPLGEGRRRNEPYPQPYSPRPNRKGASSSGGPGGEGASGTGTDTGTGTGTGTEGVGASGSGIPGSGGPSNDPESGEKRRGRKCPPCRFM